MQGTLNPELRPSLVAAVVIPVLTIDDAAAGVDLARALMRGGLAMLEVTLRTPAALTAIERIAGEVEDIVVGAGTILTPRDGEAAIRAGSRFLVSPGSTPVLLDAAEHWDVPLLPGCATASEAMVLMARGYRIAKFFPAEASGGVAFLSAVSAPLAAMAFCPTGGIKAANAKNYLDCPNVVCVGGSWMVPANAVKDRDWAAITRGATMARGLRVA